MLIDLHAHTSGISTCCRVPAPDIIRAAQETGIDGIVLCNHYQRGYVRNNDCAAFAKRYTDEYEYTKSCGDAVGFRVLYGMELTMEKHGGAHILVYGLDLSFTLEHPELFALTMEELYTLVKANGGAVVQAHPFRNGKDMLQNLAYLDGVEANSHPLYDATHFDRLTDIAHGAGLILTSGGDFHADTHRPHCGTYLPETVTNTKELADYLCSVNEIELQIQEPKQTESRRVLYKRN